MPIILDVFNNDAFAAVELTGAINVVPNTYGRLNELGLFAYEGVPTTAVAIEYVDGQINLLPTRVRGGPPSLGTPSRGRLKYFGIPHIPHDDFVTADDIQNIVARSGGLGSTLALENVQGVVNKKLATMRGKHAITLEHMRVGALRGAVLDYDGSVIVNYFTEFGITEKVVDFLLGTAGTDVGAKCDEVVGYMEDNLNGEVMSGVRALASPEWMAKFTAHASVKTAYQYFASAPNPLRESVRKGFPFKGITFEEYRGSATQLNEDGSKTARRFIPAGEVRFFPEGTNDTFKTYFAPADFIETINTVGQEEVYAKQAVDPEFQRWVKIHTQSNPLPLVKRPALLVRGTTSN